MRRIEFKSVERVKNYGSGIEEVGAGNLYLCCAGDGWKALITTPSSHTVSQDANKESRTLP